MMASHRAMRSGTYRLAGVSMFPLSWPLRAGLDRSQTLHRGDVVAFIGAGGKLTFHRVHRVIEDGYITRGDTNLRFDAPVPQSAVLGRVDWIGVGPVGVLLPATGLAAGVSRRSGLLWAQVAPGLRGAVRQARRWIR